MKNTFDTLERQHRLIVTLLLHRQKRKPEYTRKKWNAMKMDRYRTSKKLNAALPERYSYENLVSPCLFTNWKKFPGVFLREFKGKDLNVEVTRVMKQLLKGS